MLNFVRMMFVVVCLSINFVAHSEEVCLVSRDDVISKIENRTFPSVFGAWHYDMVNYDKPDDTSEWEYHREMLMHHDLFWSGIFRGTRLEFDANTGKSQVISIGGTDYDVRLKSEITDRNPNFLYIATLRYYGTRPENHPEDWEYWLRDKDGNRIKNDEWPEYLIDYTLPGAVEYFVQRAVCTATGNLDHSLI